MSYVCRSNDEAFSRLRATHDGLEQYITDLLKIIMRRVQSFSDVGTRTKNVTALVAACEDFVKKYNDTLLVHIRSNRHRLASFVRNCSQPTKALIDRVNRVHAFMLKSLDTVVQYMASETDDNGAFDVLFRRIVSTRTDIEQNRVAFESTFRRKTFLRLVLVDNYVHIVYAIKVIKAAVGYLSIRVAAQWFDNAVQQGYAEAHDLAYMVRRFLVMTAMLDFAIVGFLYAISKGVLPAAGAVWKGLLIDGACSGAVNGVTALALARVFSRRRYFKMQTSRDTNVRVFVRLITYVTVINACVPYFLIY